VSEAWRIVSAVHPCRHGRDVSARRRAAWRCRSCSSIRPRLLRWSSRRRSSRSTRSPWSFRRPRSRCPRSRCPRSRCPRSYRPRSRCPPSSSPSARPRSSRSSSARVPSRSHPNLRSVCRLPDDPRRIRARAERRHRRGRGRAVRDSSDGRVARDPAARHLGALPDEGGSGARSHRRGAKTRSLEAPRMPRRAASAIVPIARRARVISTGHRGRWVRCIPARVRSNVSVRGREFDHSQISRCIYIVFVAQI
jgi:hypothetical protein